MLDSISFKLTPVYKEAAVNKVSAAIRIFLEANPDFKGVMNIPVINFKQEDFKKADNDHLQRLTLEAKCLKALMHKKVQAELLRRISKSYKNIRVANLDVSYESLACHVNISITI